MKPLLAFEEHFLTNYLENRSIILNQFQAENQNFITNLIQSAMIFLSNSENWNTVEKNLGIFILFCTDLPDRNRKEFAAQLIQSQSNHASLFSLKLLNALQ